MTERRFDIANAFLNLQDQLSASYRAIRAVTSHGPTIGDEAEIDWCGLMRDFLPFRYQVGRIFAVDHTGAMSEQIDCAIYDQQYTPLWFGAKNGIRFVPVEAVYAVFEVKPKLGQGTIQAAIQKISSVRRLTRTSAPIVHAGGKFAPVDHALRPILGGILTATLGWSDDTAQEKIRLCVEPLRETALVDGGALDIGIALDKLSFDFTPVVNGEDYATRLAEAPLAFSSPDRQLIHFVIRLFRQLQPIGTVLALDMNAYENAL